MCVANSKLEKKKRKTTKKEQDMDGPREFVSQVLLCGRDDRNGLTMLRGAPRRVIESLLIGVHSRNEQPTLFGKTLRAHGDLHQGYLRLRVRDGNGLRRNGRREVGHHGGRDLHGIRRRVVRGSDGGRGMRRRRRSLLVLVHETQLLLLLLMLKEGHLLGELLALHHGHGLALEGRRVHHERDHPGTGPGEGVVQLG